MPTAEEAKIALAEQATEELDIRAGRQEAALEDRPLKHLDEEELERLSRWDPESDPEVIEDMGDGIVLRKRKRRTSARRRLQGEPEPESIDDALEADRQQPKAEVAPKPKPQAPKRVSAKPPTRARARLPLTTGLSQAVGLAGLGLQLTGRDIPVGRALTFEAPVAGEKLDQLIAGTFLDRLLQPIARAGGAAKDFGGLLALPLLVGLIERRPQLYPIMEPFLKSLVADMVVQVAQSAEIAQARVEEAIKRNPKLQAEVDQTFESFFAGMFGPPPEVPVGDQQPVG